MDYLCIAMTDLGNISERRVNLLLDSSISGLPSFLIKEPGLNSGLMMIQYLDAAIAAENKILASPASIDNISVSANQEDHVSMGFTASKKAYQLVRNIVQMVAIEFYTAYQALGFKEDKNKISNIVLEVFNFISKDIPLLTEDKFFDEEVNWIARKIENQLFTDIAKKKLGHIFGDNL